MENLSPEQLFFRYTWPCAEKRLMERKITEIQYRRLKTYKDNPHLSPEQILLEACFPQVFDSLRILGNETGRSAWDSRNVEDYWRMFHDGPSPVRVCVVEERRGDGTLFASFHDGSELLINPYSLTPEKGCRVYVHMHCVIESYEAE